MLKLQQNNETLTCMRLFILGLLGIVVSALVLRGDEPLLDILEDRPEDDVVALAADDAEDREAAYRKILADPKQYREHLKEAAKSEDPELQKHASILWFYCQLGIDATVRSEILEKILRTRDAPKEDRHALVHEMFSYYGQQGGLTGAEFYSMIQLHRSFDGIVCEALRIFVLQQAAQGFILPKTEGRTPLSYASYVLSEMPRSVEFDIFRGHFQAFTKDTIRLFTENNLASCWRKIIEDPDAYEYAIRLRYPDPETLQALDLALHKTEDLERIYKERGDIYDYSQLYDGRLPKISALANDWMHRNQMGENPDTNIWAIKMFHVLLGSRDARDFRNLATALDAIGWIPQLEILSQYFILANLSGMYGDWNVAWGEGAEHLKVEARKSLEYMKQQDTFETEKRQLELVHLFRLLACLEERGEWAFLSKICAQLAGCLDINANFLAVFMSIDEREAISPFVQYQLALSSSSSLDIFVDHWSEQEGLMKELPLLYPEMRLQEQLRLFYAIQQKIPCWEDFAHACIKDLQERLRAGKQYDAHALYNMVHALCLRGLHCEAYELMLLIQAPLPKGFSLLKYQMVREALDRGNIAGAEEFLQRMDRQLHASTASYWLAASDIAKAKGGIPDSQLFKLYALILEIMSVSYDKAMHHIFIHNLIRGGYLQDAERLQLGNREGAQNMDRLGTALLKQGKWAEARFFFEQSLHYMALYARRNSWLRPLVLPARVKSELAQALLYRSYGEQDKAQAHLSRCLELAVYCPQIVGDVFELLLSEKAQGSIQEKQSWREGFLPKMEMELKKNPQHPLIPPAIRKICEMGVCAGGDIVSRPAERPTYTYPEAPNRIWKYKGEDLEGRLFIQIVQTAYIKLTDGYMKLVWLKDLSPEDQAYIAAWSPEKKIVEEYDDLCSQHPDHITWLKDPMLAEQIATQKNKSWYYVFLPAEDSPEYQYFYPILMSKKLHEMVSPHAVCALLTPEKDGQWSAINRKLRMEVKTYGSTGFVPACDPVQDIYDPVPIPQESDLAPVIFQFRDWLFFELESPKLGETTKEKVELMFQESVDDSKDRLRFKPQR